MIAPDPPVREDPSSYQDVRVVVSELMEACAAGVCWIPGELLEAGGKYMIWCLRGMCIYVFHQYCPPNWRRGLVTRANKRRGYRKGYEKYRGIILLSFQGRISRVSHLTASATIWPRPSLLNRLFLHRKDKKLTGSMGYGL